MHSFESLLLVLVMLVNLYLVSTEQLKSAIQTVALQGMLLGCMPLFVAHEVQLETVCLAIIFFIGKGIAIPALLLRAMREVTASRDVEPLVSMTGTMILLALITGAALLVTPSLPLITDHRTSLVLPCAISTITVGVILMVFRKKAITQVVGFVALENGIFAFGLLLLETMPLMVELVILLDLFGAIFVMGIIINQVRRTFSSLDTHHLSALKE